MLAAFFPKVLQQKQQAAVLDLAVASASSAAVAVVATPSAWPSSRQLWRHIAEGALMLLLCLYWKHDPVAAPRSWALGLVRL